MNELEDRMCREMSEWHSENAAFIERMTRKGVVKMKYDKAQEELRGMIAQLDMSVAEFGRACGHDAKWAHNRTCGATNPAEAIEKAREMLSERCRQDQAAIDAAHNQEPEAEAEALATDGAEDGRDDNLVQPDRSCPNCRQEDCSGACAETTTGGGDFLDDWRLTFVVPSVAQLANLSDDELFELARRIGKARQVGEVDREIAEQQLRLESLRMQRDSLLGGVA